MTGQCDDAISKARRAICGAIRELQAANIPVPQALYAALAQLQAGAFQSSPEGNARPEQ